MYPQTHIFFAERVFGFLSGTLALGSIFPDIATGFCASRQDSHGRGAELLVCLREDNDLIDFARGIITHGIVPRGIDYYGDEKYLSFERGYCFEKGRSLIEETIRACNLPPEMGWWKSHNIVEMGIELTIGNSGPYGEVLSKTFTDNQLMNKVSNHISCFYHIDPFIFRRRMQNFANYIDTSRVSAQSLAERYDVQMFVKHRIHIDTARVAKLILRAAEIVSTDFNDFFLYVLRDVQRTLASIES
jgi:hypothetical protein